MKNNTVQKLSKIDTLSFLFLSFDLTFWKYLLL